MKTVHKKYNSMGVGNNSTPDERLEAVTIPEHCLETLPPKVGDEVYTPYGPGTVESFRDTDGMYVVVMKWRLANMQAVRSYVKADHVSKYAPASVAPKVLAHKVSPAMTARENMSVVFSRGSAVSTAWGPGRVVKYRVGEGMYEVKLDWTLANGINAIAFAQPGMISRRQKANVGDFVQTQYGSGVVEGFRKADGAHRVRLTQLHGGAVAFLQSTSVYGKLQATVGSMVSTQYGRGMMVKYRSVDGIYSVRLPYAQAFLSGSAVSPLSNDKKQVKSDGSCTML